MAVNSHLLVSQGDEDGDRRDACPTPPATPLKWFATASLRLSCSNDGVAPGLATVRPLIGRWKDTAGGALRQSGKPVTLARASVVTPLTPARLRDTVAGETPAAAATCLMVVTTDGFADLLRSEVRMSSDDCKRLEPNRKKFF